MWLVLLLVTLGSTRVVEAVSDACPKHIVPKILTATTGTISTPNFPNKFETPFCERWIIDAGPFDERNPKYIHLYYTQPYLKNMTPPYFIVEFYESFPDDPLPGQFLSPTVDNAIRKSRDDVLLGRTKRAPTAAPLLVYHPHNLDGPLTVDSTIYTQRYMNIEVRIKSLYDTHFRATDDFIHTYGFNLTYVIGTSQNGIPGRCSLYSCSAAGNCYAAHDYRSFFCGCHDKHHGQYCQYSSKCDPYKNPQINPCKNGGECVTMASGSAYCSCRSGFIGQTCNRRNTTSIIACPGPHCLESCDKLDAISSVRSCSCHNGTMSRQGWVLYEASFEMVEQNQSIWTIRDKHTRLTMKDLQIKLKIEANLTETLKTMVPALDKMGNVSVVSFREARVDFQFYGPPIVFNEARDALNESTVGEVYPNISLKSLVHLRSLAFELLNVSVRPTGTIKENDNYSITCSAVGSLNITFKWFKDDTPIDTSLAVWKRITEMVWRDDNSLSWSTLNFDKAHVNDGGTFTCQVSDSDEARCKDLEMEVLTKPVLMVNPLSMTLIKNASDAVITCVAALDSAERKWGYDWKIDGEPIQNSHTNEVREELFPRGSLLRIINAQLSKTYTCIVTNNAGEARVDVRVEVLESSISPSCAPQKTSHSLLSWETTAPDQTAKRPCPTGYGGFAKRKCHTKPGFENPVWGEPDFSNCVSKKLKAISKSVQNAKLGFTNRTHLSRVVKELSIYLQNKKSLYLGEGETVISILRDVGFYSLEKGNMSDSEFFVLFLNTTTTLLAFQDSCFYENSLISLCDLVYRMTTNYTQSIEFSYKSDALIIRTPKMALNSSLIFSVNKMFPNWPDFQLEIPNNEETETKFMLVIFRNLTSPVRIRPGNQFKLISPLVYIRNSSYYDFYQHNNMILQFKISNQWATKIINNHVNISCGSLDVNPGQRTFSWNVNACATVIANGTVQCHCDRWAIAQVGLLARDIDHEEIVEPLSLHWSVLFGCITCIISCTLALVSILIYMHCQFVTNSIYLLKLVACFSLIISILLILSMRADKSSIPLTTCLYTFLIISLSCHITKSLKVFATSCRINPFPWLQSVSLLNLLLGITFGCVLPTWTSAAVMLNYSSTEVLDEHTTFFGIFAGTLVLIFLVFLSLYVKTILQLRANFSFVDSPDYRMKTMNRALAITLSTMMTTLTAILHTFCRTPSTSHIYQYFFGISAFTMGLIVLFSYTIKSEYPIPAFVTQYIGCVDHSVTHDPEMPSFTELRNRNRSPEKRATENGHASSILLHRRSTSDSRNSSEPETTMETLGGSSVCSVATRQKRLSLGSTRIPRSLTDPPDMDNFRMDRFRNIPERTEWHNLPFRSSMNSNGFGLSNGSMLGLRPLAARCLLADTSAATNVQVSHPSTRPKFIFPKEQQQHTGDYVKPSVGQSVTVKRSRTTSEANPPRRQTTPIPDTFHSKRLRVDVEVQPTTTFAFTNPRPCNPSSQFKEKLPRKFYCREEDESSTNSRSKARKEAVALLNGFARQTSLPETSSSDNNVY